METLLKSILSTIVYYDVLDYPLTSFEIWKYLACSMEHACLPARQGTLNIEHGKEDKPDRIMLGDIIKALELEDLKKHIEEFRGFYFLRGRKDLVFQRIERNKISQKKFKIIRRAVFWLKFVPFVRMIAITGRMAMKNAEKKSDLDFLVVLEKGKMFTGRFLFTLVAQFLGKRRHGKKITDRICLNYFITDGSLEIDFKDIYSSSEYSFIFPVYGPGIFQKFQQANSWIGDFKINYQPDEVSNLKLVLDSGFASIIKNIGEAVFSFSFMEKILKKWQMKRIAEDPRTFKQGSAVMASDEALIFLPDPHGPKIYQKFKEKLANLS